MNLYLLTQTENTGYDTYDSCVVIANTEEEAKLIHPGSLIYYPVANQWFWRDSGYKEYLNEGYYSNDSWCKYPEQVTVTYLGEFKGNLEDYPSKIVCVSFNAG